MEVHTQKSKKGALIKKKAAEPDSQLMLLFLIALLVSIMTVFPFIIKNGIYNQDDLAFHKMILESYYECVKQLNFFPKIFFNMANGYGYAADLFYPSIFLLPYAIFRLLGFSFTNAYFLYQITISLAAFLCSYYFFKKISEKFSPSLLFASFYTLSTYRLIDQTIRGALGETLVFIFLPIAMLGLFYIFHKKNYEKWYILTIGMVGSILSHFITSFFLFLFIIGILLLSLTNFTEFKKNFMALFKAGLTSLALLLWLFLPIIEQTRHANFNYQQMAIWSIGFDYGIGDFVGQSLTSVSGVWNDLSPNIGIVLLIPLIVSPFYYKKANRPVRICIMASLFFTIASTNLFPWSYFKESIFAAIQFPWRLLIFVTFFTSIIAVYILADKLTLDLKNTLLWITGLLLLTISFNGYTLYRFEQMNTDLITDENYAEFQLNALGGGKEYLVKDTNYDLFLQNTSHNISITGKTSSFQITPTKDESGVLEATIQVEENAEVLFPLSYYYGYQATVNNKQSTLYEKNGQIALKLNKGKYTIKIEYKKTEVQKKSLMISVVIFFLFIVFLVRKWFKNTHNKKRFSKNFRDGSF